MQGLENGLKHSVNMNHHLQGEIEVDESYFGARRTRGKRGRGSYGKHLHLEYYREMQRFTLRLHQIVQEPRYRLL